MAVNQKDLERIFGAEKAKAQPSQNELDFADNRAQIEEDTFPLLSIKQYEHNYERFCEYGLEDKMLKKVEPHVRYLSRFKPSELMESTFYKRFKDKKIVRQYVEENINLKKQPSDE